MKRLTALLIGTSAMLLDSVALAGAAPVSICHIPPDNPANRRVISVGASAVASHLAHGDNLLLTSETCNGIDDDCDGAVDDDPTDAGGDCTAGVGACAAHGALVCVDGALACNAVPGDPSQETCNGIDDDCNGAVDEGGVCEPNPCEGKDAGQTCDSGTDDGVLTCEDGACGTCVPAGTCSSSEGPCAFDADCPTDETCTDPSPRYVDNGDGTVTDRRTCLVWEKKTGTVGTAVDCVDDDSCGDPHDVNNRYAWTSSGTAFDGPAKTLFIDALNTVPCFAGHCDWRLPESEGYENTGQPAEMESLLLAPFPHCSMSPCIDTIFEPTAPDYYWSATPYSDTFAWFALFSDGYTDGTFKTSKFHVRAVRGGS